jgi:endonuclease YncB( thermonuclease family)
MATLVCPLIWSMLTVASPATRPAEAPPMFDPPNLADAPLVPAQNVEGPDSVQVLRDGGVVTVRLAGVAYPQQNAGATDAAVRFLRQMLVGEKVWLVPAGPPQTCDTWYLYRWPDELCVNLELVRQGCADAAAEAHVPAATRQALVYWRDLARKHHKGIWATAAPPVGQAPAAALTGKASAAAPASQAATPKPTVAPSPQQSDASDKSLVYVTAHGKKYHRANCRSLRAGGKAIPLAEARKTYEPCKQCNPPQ